MAYLCTYYHCPECRARMNTVTRISEYTVRFYRCPECGYESKPDTGEDYGVILPKALWSGGDEQEGCDAE